MSGVEEVRMREGELWWFDNKQYHESYNESGRLAHSLHLRHTMPRIMAIWPSIRFSFRKCRLPACARQSRHDLEKVRPPSREIPCHRPFANAPFCARKISG